MAVRVWKVDLEILLHLDEREVWDSYVTWNFKNLGYKVNFLPFDLNDLLPKNLIYFHLYSEINNFYAVKLWNEYIFLSNTPLHI